MKNRVRDLRKARNMTQPQLASELGVSLATIQNWESEKTDMTGWSLYMLCEFFGVTPDEVYGDGARSKSWEAETELLQLFRNMTDDGKKALLATARGLSEAYAVKNNPISNEEGQELTA